MLTYQVLDSVRTVEHHWIVKRWCLKMTGNFKQQEHPLHSYHRYFWPQDFESRNSQRYSLSLSLQLLACRWTLNVWLTRPSLIWNIPQNTTPNSYMMKIPRELMKSDLLLFKNIIIQLSSSDITWPQTPWGRCLVNAPKLHPTPI